MATIDCVDKTTREINLAIKQLLAQGVAEITVQNPAARHNLGVALLQATKITFTGSVGYYCAGMSDGPTVEIQGSAGWGLAESMLSGTIHVAGQCWQWRGGVARRHGGHYIIFDRPDLVIDAINQTVAAVRTGAPLKL